MPIVVGLSATLIGAIFIFWISIKVLKRKVRGWRRDLIPLFLFSVGSIDPRKITLWTDCGLSEADAKIIVRQQLGCLLELPIGFIVGCALSLFFVQ